MQPCFPVGDLTEEIQERFDLRLGEGGAVFLQPLQQPGARRLQPGFVTPGEADEFPDHLRIGREPLCEVFQRGDVLAVEGRDLVKDAHGVSAGPSAAFSRATSVSSSAIRALSLPMPGARSSSVKRGVMCWGQLTSQASMVKRIARSGFPG